MKFKNIKVKVIIAGSRKFKDYSILSKEVDKFTNEMGDIEIVSGGADGADKLGERYAKDKNVPLYVFKPDWDKHGKFAGIFRNREMANFADACICFWDGSSKGTENMIKEARNFLLPTRVVNYYTDNLEKRFTDD